MAIVQDLSGNNFVDRKYASANRKVTAATFAATVPLYPGELILATDTGMIYRAQGSLATDGWATVTLEK